MFRLNSVFRIAPTKTSAPQLGGMRAYTQGVWSDRESGFENYDVKKHDAELLEKLRKAEAGKIAAEAAKKEAEARAKAAEEKNNTQQAPRTERKEREIPSAKAEFVSMEEYLSFRKEIIGRLRELEDDIHELRSQKYK